MHHLYCSAIEYRLRARKNKERLKYSEGWAKLRSQIKTIQRRQMTAASHQMIITRKLLK
jgi:hypothetical protein